MSMMNPDDAFKKPLGVRGVIIALLGMALWIAVAAVVSTVAQVWLSRGVAHVIGHTAGAVLFGVLMHRTVYTRSSAGEQAI
jgi:hypothetical protein